MTLPLATDSRARLGRYGWSGGRYRALMREIIAANHRRVTEAVARLKIAPLGATGHWRRLTMPDVREVFPTESAFLRKGAERGKLLCDALRARLSRDLQAALASFSTPGGDQAFLYQVGVRRGRINPRLARVFERKILETFEGYARRDPEIGSPPNIRTIAVTETRAAVNDVKQAYFRRVAEANPGVEIVKRWRHNPHLSDEPRPGHAAVDGAEVGLDEYFALPVYERRGDRLVRTSMSRRLLHPHDPRARPEDVINCHCDVDYAARRKS